MNVPPHPAESARTYADELVVLLDRDGNAIGTACKATVHHTATPLHLAFSCYVFDTSDRLLVTRRALGKATWPGWWTNTLCGHPAPEEGLVQAVIRRGRQELGLELREIRLVLPRFRYRAAMPDGVLENELCPVFVATASTDPLPQRQEVEDWQWVAWPDFRDAVLSGQREVSPWCVMQVTELAGLERYDGSFPAGDPGRLPPAAR